MTSPTENKMQKLRDLGVQDDDSARDFFVRFEKQVDSEDLKQFVKHHNELREDNRDLKNKCAKLGVNQILLGAATVFFGIASIVSTVVAVRASKDTVVGVDGVLVAKGTGDDVLVHSKGVSVVSQLRDFLDDEGDTVECFKMADIAELYKAFGEGTDALVHTDGSAATAGFDDGSTVDGAVTKIQGAAAFMNDTHVIIGDLAIDISPDNPCNSGGEEFPDGSLKVFRDHLDYLLGKNHDEIHRVQQCYGYGRGYGGYGRGYGGYGGYGRYYSF